MLSPVVPRAVAVVGTDAVIFQEREERTDFVGFGKAIVDLLRSLFGDALDLREFHIVILDNIERLFTEKVNDPACNFCFQSFDNAA